MSLQTATTMRSNADVAAAVVVLLRELIDYAGLFPPASLSMVASVANYDRYLQSEWNWILGRFIVPVSRLGEFEEALAGLLALPAPSSLANWRLSVLLGADATSDVARIREFNARMAGSGFKRSAVVDSVEVKVASAAEIVQLSGIIPAELGTYVELPLSSASECIPAVAACGRRAKIRTGGETADMFPSPASVIEFIRLCVSANVPFKATAGLHHPLRSVHKLTYQPESASGMMHGFLNVFLAAAFLRSGMEPALAIQLLEEQMPTAFHVDADGIGWREQRLTPHEIAAARQGFALSFGSCSFTEPIDDLRALHLL
jgi:hypothetical protein